MSRNGQGYVSSRRLNAQPDLKNLVETTGITRELPTRQAEENEPWDQWLTFRGFEHNYLTQGSNQYGTAVRCKG